MDYQTILTEIKGNIAFLTMNNPATLNALSGQTVNELNRFMDEIEEDRAVRVVIITGSGKAFVAGADIEHMSSMSPPEAMRFSYDISEVHRKISESDKVFIAAINGFALGGGCELALACDIRLASDNVRIGLPEVSLGIIPGGGGTQRLSRVVGIAKAKELIFTGAALKAEEAFSIGLVNRVTTKEALLTEAEAMAEKIIKNGPIAVGYAKACINMSAEMDLYAGIGFEKNMFGLCFATQDQKEGMAAFLDKREVVFRGL